MATLFLDRRGVLLEEEGGALVVRAPGEAPRRVPLTLLDRVVIYARTALDSTVLSRLAAQGVACLVLDPRHAERAALVSGGAGPDARRRLRQYQAATDAGWCEAWTRRLLDYKLAGQRRLLLEAAEARSTLAFELRKAAAAVERARAGVRAGEGRAPAAWMGTEGAAANAYFTGYQLLFPPALGFQGRNRRPPRDPVNVCLSLAYTLVHAEAVRVIVGAGLDPYVGFYHQPAHGRESLACDLVELERSSADAWVWDLFRRRGLRAEHFHWHEGACRLGKAGRRVVYEAWEERAAGLTRRLRRRTRWLVRALTGEPARGATDEIALS
jgi:CRISPR-associated protein Cas1